MIRCRQCNTELTEHAHFCNICGLLQNPPEPKMVITTPIEQIKRCGNCATELPEEARFCAVCGAVQTSKESYEAETTSTEDLTLTPQPETSDPAQRESISYIPIQTPGALSPPARTPGLIRPVTPKSTTRSVIPLRTVSPRATKSKQQSKHIPQAPAHPIPAPTTKVSSNPKQQSQQSPISSYMQPDVRSQDKQQIADLATQQNQEYSQPKVNGNIVQSHPQEQNAGVQITPVSPSWQKASNYTVYTPLFDSSSTVYANEKNDIADSPTMDLPIPASFIATSKAAEQWRKSWRDRQYAEAGPAENVSRGQASVPMPLMTRQRSFASMRAFEKNDKKQQGKRLVTLVTRITIFLIICLILSLGVYIIISYLLHSAFGVTNVTSPTNTTQPTIAVLGTASQTVKIGQTIQLHGEHSRHKKYTKKSLLWTVDLYDYQ
jgi:RNA polymerase subunit RPABC4/transcription elongation factor Spt4